MVERVTATVEALEFIDYLKKKHNSPLMFYQSGGCCDNTVPNCLLPGEITISGNDELLGEIGGCPFYISKSHYEFHKHTQVIIDLQHCYGGGDFSLDRPEGKSFISRSRLFTDAEWADLVDRGLCA